MGKHGGGKVKDFDRGHAASSVVRAKLWTWGSWCKAQIPTRLPARQGHQKALQRRAWGKKGALNHLPADLPASWWCSLQQDGFYQCSLQLTTGVLFTSVDANNPTTLCNTEDLKQIQVTDETHLQLPASELTFQCHHLGLINLHLWPYVGLSIYFW